MIPVYVYDEPWKCNRFLQVGPKKQKMGSLWWLASGHGVSPFLSLTATCMVACSLSVYDYFF